MFDFSGGEDVAETNAARRGAVKSVGAIATRKAAANSSEEVNDGAAKEGRNKKRAAVSQASPKGGNKKRTAVS